MNVLTSTPKKIYIETLLSKVVKFVLIAGLYYCFGRFALFFALPPGYASPVWPSSGIVLAFILLYGRRYWPAVFLGSFVLNFPSGVGVSELMNNYQLILVAIGIALGASAQALFGAFLVRKFISATPALTKIKDIFTFFFLGGVISCVVSPTVGISVLLLSGSLVSTEAMTHWLIWWMGDILGVFLFASLILSWFSSEKKTWVKRRLSLSIFSVLVIGVTFIFLYVGQEAQYKSLQTQLETDAMQFKFALSKKFAQYDLVLRGIQGFYKSSQHVDRQEFHTYVSHFRESIPEFKSVAWVPKIIREDKDKYIESAMADGVNFHIKTVDSEKQFIETSEREAYYPIFYIEPMKGNEIALGINNGSESSRWKATQLAIDTGLVVASAPIILTQDKKSGNKSLLMSICIYKNGNMVDSVESRRENVLGLVTATAGIEDIMQKVLDTAKLSYVSVSVSDITENEILVYKNDEQAYRDSNISAVQINIEHDSRMWSIEVLPTAEFFTVYQTGGLWLVLVGVFMFAGLLNALLLVATGQTVEVGRIVMQKTAELKRAKKRLEKEYSFKEQSVKELTKEKENFEKQRRATMIILGDLHEERKKLRVQKTALDNFAIVTESTVAGKITYANDRFYQVSQYDPEEVIGKYYRDILNSKIHPKEFWDEFWNTIQSGIVWRGDIRNKNKKGTFFWVDKTVVPVLGTDDKIEKYVSIDVLITDKKIAESALAEEREFLKKTNLELDSFVYTASHDLRAPLRGISSFAGLLLKDYHDKLDEEGRLYLEKVDQGAKRMSQLINDLLALSRITRLEEEFEENEVQGMLDSVLERIEFDIQEKNVELFFQNNLPKIKCNRTKITEVFLNLINNAIKFSSKKNANRPRVEVNYAEVDGMHQFCVKDNGIGIKPEYHKQIFGIFKRLHTNEEYEGTGLGLNIVKRVVEDHRGKIWIESDLGSGAAFYFTIPITLQ